MSSSPHPPEDEAARTLEIVEGRVGVTAALEAGQRRFEHVLVREGTDVDSLREIVEHCQRQGVPLDFVPESALEEHAHGRSHGGVIARCGPKPWLAANELLALVDRTLARREKGGEAPLLLLLEGADDARNLGFVLRSAEAFGVHAVLLRRRRFDFDPAEVSRPSSGAYERLPLALLDDLAPVDALIERGLRLVGCIANVRRTIHEAHFEWPTILAVGGEKRGLSGAVRSKCDRLVRIPTLAGTSLSMSHAASIVLAEAARHRHASRPTGPC